MWAASSAEQMNIANDNLIKASVGFCVRLYCLSGHS